MHILCALGVAALASVGVTAASIKPKRGWVADGCTGSSCTDPQLLGNLGWYYDYNVADPFGDEATASERFAPMHWCLSTLNSTVPRYVNTTYMLGFNEPNNVHNCNRPASDVAAAWGQVMQQWPNSQLVSPATAGDGTAFFDEFFAACKTFFGASGCRISYVAIHDYSCTASKTMAYIDSIYKRYGYPVWLTEFSCGDGAAGKPTSAHLTYMKEIVPQLDAAPHVYRYAWMSGRDSHGLRGLVEVGAGGTAKLTQLGQVYASL